MAAEVKTSVVVCTFNRADVLAENIGSVLAQRTDDFEAIYVDDGSTDATPDILADYARGHPERLVVVTVPNSGPGPARNAGVNRARGEFILFTDDDAVVPPDWVSGMLAARARRDCDVLCGSIDAYTLETKAERYLHHRMQTTLGPKAKPLSAAPTGNLLMPRELFLRVGGFSPKRLLAAEDWELSHRLRAAGASIWYDPSVAVRHRYQRDWAAAVARVRRMGAMGVRVCRGRWPSTHAYVALSVARFLASPLWLARRYPADLYLPALRMEAAFCAGRVGAWLDMTLKGPRQES